MIEVTDNGGSIDVTYTDGDGDSATATVVGESLSSVKDRKEEIVSAHNLRDKV